MPTTLSGAVWPAQLTARLGPFKDGSGDLWVIAGRLIGGNGNLAAFKSTDNGASFDSGNASGSGTIDTSGAVCDAVYDGSDAIYALAYSTTKALQIWKFTISSATWSEVYTSGTRPTVNVDALPHYIAFLTRRSTGEFVVCYQGPTHSLMGTPYRTCYYARCSSAGVWSAGVEVSGAVKTHHYDCKSATLGASDRTHMVYTDSVSGLLHTSLSSGNALSSTDTVASGTGKPSYLFSCFYDSTLAKVLIDNLGTINRGDSSATPSWAADTNAIGSEESTAGLNALDFSYEPNINTVFVFFRDLNTDDLFYNGTTTTTWTTANAVVLEAGTVNGISTDLITGAIGVVYNDNGTVKLTKAVIQYTESAIIGTITTPDPVQIYTINTALRDTYNATFTTIFKIDDSANRVATPFTTDSSTQLYGIRVKQKGFVSGTLTDNVICEIQGDASGSPNGTVIASLSLPFSSSFTEGGRRVFQFDIAVSLNPSTSYWAVFRRSGSTDITNNFGIDTSSTAPNDLKTSSNSGGSYASQSFKTITLISDLTRTEMYFITTGTEYTESATIANVTTPSSSELMAKWYEESATITGSTTPIVTSEIAQFVDATTVGVTTTPGGTDVHEYTESATITSVTTPLSTDITQFVESTLIFDNYGPRLVSEAFGWSFNVKLGQSFPLDKTSILNSIIVEILKTGTPTDNIYMDLCSDSSDAPGSVIATADNSILGSSLSGWTDCTFTFKNSPVILTNGIYWFVLRRQTQDDSNYYNAGCTDFSYFAGGKYRPYVTFWADGDIQIDLRFKLNSTVSETVISTITTVSGTDEYTAGGPTEYTDLATIGSVTTPSTVDVADYVESATVSAVTTPSSAEYQTYVYTDDATINPVTTPSSTEFQTYVYTDAATVNPITTPSTADVYAGIDAATINPVTTPIVTAEEAAYVDAQTVNPVTTPSATESRDYAVESATVTTTITPSATELAEFVDEAIVASATVPSSTLEEHATYDSETINPITTPSADEVYTPGAAEYTDEATIGSVTNLSSIELTEFVDAFTINPVTSPSSTDLADFVDAITINPITSLSATELHELFDAATVTTSTVLLSSEESAFNDALTISSVTTIDSTEGHEVYDSATATFIGSVSATELSGFLDAFTITTATTPSSEEIYSLTYLDSATLTTNISISTVEETGYVDDSIATSITTPSSTEASQFVDSSDVSTITSISATELFVLAPQRLLPIANIASGDWLPSDGSSPLYSLVADSSSATYIYATAV